MAQQPPGYDFENGPLAREMLPLMHLQERPYRALGQENVRGILALGLVGALVVLLLVLALRAPFTTWDEFVQLAQLLIGALSGLVGLAVGFYLGKEGAGRS